MKMKGFYINLARSPQRRQAMDAQLHRLGLDRVERFEAIDAGHLPPMPPGPLTRGEQACFLSHAGAIGQADPAAFTLILEDDALLSDALPAVLQGEALGQLAHCDVVLLECLPYIATTNLLALWSLMQRRLPPAPQPRHQISGVDILEAKNLYNWGAVAYLVTPRGRDTLQPLLREALDNGPRAPFDKSLNQWIRAGRLRAAVLLPFLATPRLESHAATTITDRPQAARNDVLSGALRRLFFAGPIDGLADYAAAWRHAPLTDDRELRLLADLMAQLFVIAASAPPDAG
jgi:GR25 family glycosyltransferase involved in LPS biosynthesis